MEWLDRAACAGEDPEMFFPVGGSGPALREARAAKKVCHRCPVVTECLEWALQTGQTTGVWGDTTETERAEMFKARRRRNRRRASGERGARPSGAPARRGRDARSDDVPSRSGRA